MTDRLEALWISEAEGLIRAIGRGIPLADAEDVVSEAFIRFATAVRRGAQIEDDKAYLRTAAGTALIDRFRSGASQQETATGDLMDLATADRWGYTAHGDLTFPGSFDGALRALPAEERDAFVLTELRGLTSREAAGVLGTSHMTTHRRAEIARLHVREEIR